MLVVIIAMADNNDAEAKNKNKTNATPMWYGSKETVLSTARFYPNQFFLKSNLKRVQQQFIFHNRQLYVLLFLWLLFFLVIYQYQAKTHTQNRISPKPIFGVCVLVFWIIIFFVGALLCDRKRNQGLFWFHFNTQINCSASENTHFILALDGSL